MISTKTILGGFIGVLLLASGALWWHVTRESEALVVKNDKHGPMPSDSVPTAEAIAGAANSENTSASRPRISSRERAGDCVSSSVVV